MTEFRYTDAFFFCLIPLVAGLMFVVVARMRKANAYSPILALGVMLIASGVVLEFAVLGLSLLSMVF